MPSINRTLSVSGREAVFYGESSLNWGLIVAVMFFKTVTTKTQSWRRQTLSELKFLAVDRRSFSGRKVTKNWQDRQDDRHFSTYNCGNFLWYFESPAIDLYDLGKSRSKDYNTSQTWRSHAQILIQKLWFWFCWIVCLKLKNGGLLDTHKRSCYGRIGGGVVRAHATYAANPGSIPAGGPLLHVTSLSLPYFLSVYCLIKVSMPEKIFKKKILLPRGICKIWKWGFITMHTYQML